MSNLSNLSIYRTSMREANRQMDVFHFTYNNIFCRVLIHSFSKPQNKYFPCSLFFTNPDDHTNDFECLANAQKLDVSYSHIAKFFHIQNGGQNTPLGTLYRHFYESLNRAIPNHVHIRLESDDRQLIRNKIRTIDDNIPKPYLYDVRTTGGHRTNLDNDKAAASYPDIYVHFQKDTDYSFFFTADPSKEVTLDTLLQKIEHRNHR